MPWETIPLEEPEYDNNGNLVTHKKVWIDDNTGSTRTIGIATKGRHKLTDADRKKRRNRPPILLATLTIESVCELLDIEERTLYRRLKQLGLKFSRTDEASNLTTLKSLLAVKEKKESKE